MTHAETIRELCDFLRANPAERHTLATLARRVRMSPFHLQRTFKEVVGVSPREFAEACRLESLKQELRRSPVTEAIYEAGFGSSSRVYEGSNARLGMTPATYGAGGRGASISYVTATTPLGRMLLAATDRGLCSVEFADGNAREADRVLLGSLQKEFPAAEIRPMRQPFPAEFHRWVESLKQFITSGGPHPDLPVDVRSTAWQRKVWDYLRQIPAGETRTYKQVAEEVCTAKAARAVARACASNKVAIVIPCHRVIRGDGGMGGYRWGIERKEVLLNLERK